MQPLGAPRVLHVVGAFLKQDVYLQLLKHLSVHVERQVVFVPGAGNLEHLRMSDWETDSVSVIGGTTVGRLSRPFLRARSLRGSREIRSNARELGIDIVHSHMLFSDGMIGDRIAKELGVPHVVSVRNTDRHAQWRYRWSLRGRARNVAGRAASVIYLNPFYELWGRTALLTGDGCSHVIPNGIAPFWLQHQSRSLKPVGNRPRLLYVGDFSRNKNLPGLVRACSVLAERWDGVALRLVGARPTDSSQVQYLKDIAHAEVRLEILPRTNSWETLRDAYRWANVVVLPSFHETFGVALAEALSQGRPVVCSRGEALSGYFSADEGIVQADPQSTQSIAGAVEGALKVPASKLPKPAELSRIFGWKVIATRLAQIYNKAVVYSEGARRP